MTNKQRLNICAYEIGKIRGDLLHLHFASVDDYNQVQEIAKQIDLLALKVFYNENEKK
ncbi:MAG TPA: hypothetical protein VNX01_15205 [Bacteroidia bacterium]|jgi:hypothetical protein|nr:hypothetical protein [Bacteroidia bacterium]